MACSGRHSTILFLAALLGLGGASKWVEVAANGSWPDPRYSHSAVIFGVKGREKMLIFGGNAFDPVNELFAFDTARREWSKLKPRGTPPSKRYGHQAAVTSDDRMLVLGGYNGSFLGDLHELSSEKGGKWRRIDATGAVPCARDGHTLVMAPDGQTLLLFGGFDGKDQLCDVHALDTSSYEWRQLDVAADATDADAADADGAVAEAAIDGESEALPDVDAATAQAEPGPEPADEAAAADGASVADAGAALDLGRPAPRYMHCAVSSDEGMLVYGGYLAGGEFGDDLWRLVLDEPTAVPEQPALPCEAEAHVEAEAPQDEPDAASSAAPDAAASPIDGAARGAQQIREAVEAAYARAYRGAYAEAYAEAHLVPPNLGSPSLPGTTAPAPAPAPAPVPAPPPAPPPAAAAETGPSSPTVQSGRTAYLGARWVRLRARGEGPGAIFGHAAARDAEGRLWVSGGFGAKGGSAGDKGGKGGGAAFSGALHAYDPRENRWARYEPRGDCPSPRQKHSLVVTGGRRLLLFGGNDFGPTRGFYELGLDGLVEAAPGAREVGPAAVGGTGAVGAVLAAVVVRLAQLVLLALSLGGVVLGSFLGLELEVATTKAIGRCALLLLLLLDRAAPPPGGLLRRAVRGPVVPGRAARPGARGVLGVGPGRAALLGASASLAAMAGGFPLAKLGLHAGQVAGGFAPTPTPLPTSPPRN